MLWVAAAVTVAAGVVFAVLAADVWWQRRNPAGLSLAVMLVAGAWWGFAYALELAGSDLALREAWGDAKYVGIGALVPAWLVFVLQYTGRAHLVTRRRLAMLSLEPLLSILVLAVPATHDLIRSYPANVSEGEVPVARTGPLFWGHFAYSNLLVLVATGLFVAAMARLARVYVRLATVLLAAALLPWAANLLHNFEVGPFTKLDLTPSAFTVTGGVLVWGLYRQRLVNLQPIARSLIVETMADAVLVVDAYGRVVDANPAAAVALGRSAADLVGHPLEDLLPDHHRTELALTVAGEVRYFDSRRQPLKDRRGRTAGEVLVLRDVTDAKTADARLRHVLAERSRVADALQQSLVPAALPEVKGLTLAARYAPAGDGREIGGDFYDVFPVEQGRWAVVLGDVSGKGAEAAAMTALIRYTLRALAVDGRSPEAVLRALNDVLLRESVDERYATLAYAQAGP
ncbi:MAG: SpoIIE family protein phosphatase, partial [Sporichthyaceae bacterium]|nr:SpoIIE family protein phosphatase [Sporichthyaceae bacterium]